MNAITRRDAIRASTFFLAGPLSGALRPEAAFAQGATSESSIAVAAGQSPQIDEDFLNYTLDSVARYAAKQKAGTVTNSDHTSISRNLLLVANHLDETGADAAMRQLAAAQQGQDSTRIPSKSAAKAFYEGAYQAARKYQPSLTRETFFQDIPSEFSSDDWNRGLAHLASHGISHRFRSTSDTIRHLVSNSQHVSSAGYSAPPIRHGASALARISFKNGSSVQTPELSDALYTKNRRPHLVKVVAPNCRSKTPPLTPAQCQVRADELLTLDGIAAAAGCTKAGPLAWICGVYASLIAGMIMMLNDNCQGNPW